MKTHTWVVGVLCLAIVPRASVGESVRVEVARDTWVSAVGSEATANLGGAPRLKFKSIQEMTLLDVDPESIRGHRITRATLHLRLSSAERLRRLTVSSISADWVEGASSSYEPGAPGCSFRFRENPGTPWAYPGSDLTAVTLGAGNSLWRFADASEPDANGWQTVAVEPDVLALRVADLSGGFLVFDDTGSEWTRHAETYEHRLFPNRFAHSRDSGARNAPYFEIELGPAVNDPPGPVQIGLGDDRLELRGAAGAFGYHVWVDGKRLPRWLVGRPEGADTRVALDLGAMARELGSKPGTDLELRAAAVNAVGQVGPAATARWVVPTPPEKVTLPVARESAEANPPAPVALGSRARIAIVDELETSDATSERASRSPLATNPVSLQAAQGEAIAFQVQIHGPDAHLDEADAELRFNTGGPAQPRVEIGRSIEVPTDDGRWIADPVAPIDGEIGFPKIAGRLVRSLHVEVFVPKECKPGVHSGSLRIAAGSDSVTLPVELEVWDFALPDRLRFLPEMNCYDLPANEREYYRLAHRHRTFVNRVPYYHSGQVAEGCAPAWDGHQLDWAAWDRRFGPLLDGSAFADLPRAGEPIDGFYLPIHENWPVPIGPNYNGNYWADLAFTPEYRETLVRVGRQFSQHIADRGWTGTRFQAYLNGKNDFKRAGWSRSTSPWLLDEPANFQDFWALRWFGLAFSEANRQPGSTVPIAPNLLFRADISRPQWQRDTLDGLVGYLVISNDALRGYPRLVAERRARFPQTMLEYGGANAVGTANVQAVGWCLDAWSRGADGVVPWQTIGRAESWRKADELSLFYPGRTPEAPPVPSVRLKAFRRGQQDVEYLEEYRLRKGLSRPALAEAVRGRLALAANRESGQTPATEDAGRLRYDRLSPTELRQLRAALGREIARSPARANPTERAVEPRVVEPLRLRGLVTGARATGQSGFPSD